MLLLFGCGLCRLKRVDGQRLHNAVS
ncbi:hypothetical protein FRZ06_19265 [Anoxybacterium hadale]|uniref:Uncharacterized protein n=1 Tax=Anoxybacterium hadale TaxID=3408580 RepID=A0ACD1AHP2_9FIRM|nr:hypothetical protein FRZ06_19265 [Clostridiales bacterium]